MEAANRFRRILASTVEKLHQISDNSQATKGETPVFDGNITFIWIIANLTRNAQSRH